MKDKKYIITQKNLDIHAKFHAIEVCCKYMKKYTNTHIVISKEQLVNVFDREVKDEYERMLTTHNIVEKY